jgi:hypothetical protein
LSCGRIGFVKGTKHATQRFFSARELRISLMLIILISFMSAVVFMYLIKIFGGSLKEHSILSFGLIMLGYVAVVGFLTMFFTHRFIGPFERLRYELGMVLAGDYTRRLKIRGHDDAYVKSFIDDVNRILVLLEENDRCGAELFRDFFGDLSALIGKMDPNDPLTRKLTGLRDRMGKHLR